MEILFVILYVSLLLIFGVIGRIRSVSNTLDDFYLGSRSLGFFVLFFTLYATQYSGNTLVGYVAKAYRSGFIVIMSVTFMVSVIGAYLIYAPKLFKLSRQYKFITFGDFIEYRFKSKFLVIFAAVITVFALGSFILTNLKALGYIAVVTSDGKISFALAIIFFCIIMLIYESLGGMRSVAWTDTMQGILLLAGSIAIFALVYYSYGSIDKTAAYIAKHKPQLWVAPDMSDKFTWLSTIIIVFFGASTYPHAIQRIYAAKNLSSLKRSLQFMAFIPFFTTLLIIIVGISTIEHFTGLNKEESEKVVLLLLDDITSRTPSAKWLILLYIAAIISAIMSTVDSALLSISSIIVKDIYGNFQTKRSESYLTYAGKVTSWIIMAIIAYVAIAYSYTIWRLFEMKLEILCQLAPLLFLAIHNKWIKSSSIIYGLIVGIIITMLLTFLPDFYSSFSNRPFGIHAGVWGLIFNFLIVVILSKLEIKNK